MHWKRLPLLVVVSLVLAASMAEAGPSAKTFMIYLHGGMGIPTGDFGDQASFDAGSGFQFGGGVDYLITDIIAVGLDGSYNRNKTGSDGTTFDAGGGVTGMWDEDKFTTIQFGAHARFLVPLHESSVSPYAIVGLGMYSTKEKWSISFDDGSPGFNDGGIYKTDMRPGAKIGLGADVKATEQVSVGVGLDYNFIKLDKDKMLVNFGADVSSFQYIGIQGRVTFSIAPPK
jgi:opacity protein-like surface antigen